MILTKAYNFYADRFFIFFFSSQWIKNIGFPNGPIVRYGNFFNPRDEEIFIPENHGPFGNCIPVRVNQAIFLLTPIILTSFLSNQVKSRIKIVKK